MEKYIFLDIHGVIATCKTVVDGMWDLTPACEERLSKILNKTDAVIILTSSWRCNTVTKTIEKMEEHNFKHCDKIVGVTIRSYRYIEKGVHLSIPRGVEIKQWMDTHIHSNNGKYWDKKQEGKDFTYLILDDAVDMLLEHKDNFVNTDRMKGLTDNDVERAVAILNNCN